MYAEGTVVGGRYRLVRKIGEGGMATIWEAEHQTLGSPVAVKFLQWSGPKSDEIRERFLREARVAASVRHRNVVEITDFGLTDDKTPYIVMERLQGESLADILDREGRLEPSEACRLVSLTLRGLAVVHEKGIVHRDLKPENIFIVDDPDGSYPKLLDFGVSRRNEPAARNLTQEGILVGTPDYMSPEQARGLRDIDARTDLYSMGVILYEALAARLPYESENIGDLIVMITTQPPTPIAEIVPDLSPQLVQIVDTAIAKDREERFQSARDMRWALIEAFRGDGFGDVASGVTSVSELPPPPATGSHPRITPATLDTPPEGMERPEPAQVPLGAPPTPTAGLPPLRYEPEKKKSHAAVVAVALSLVAIAAAGGVIALRRNGEAAEPESTPTPWEPAAEGLPPALTDAGPDHDGGATVRIGLVHLPEGTEARVSRIPIEGASVEVPLAPGSYVVDVVGPDGGLLFEVDHPAYVDGEYEVWAMSPAELGLDAGVAPDAGAAEPAEEPAPTKRRRRGLRNRRRPRR